MIQVNRKTQHYRIYTLLYYTRTREKKQKRKRQREPRDEEKIFQIVSVTIFLQKATHYWLYVPIVPINKGLQNFQSVFTGQQ